MKPQRNQNWTVQIGKHQSLEQNFEILLHFTVKRHKTFFLPDIFMITMINTVHKKFTRDSRESPPSSPLTPTSLQEGYSKQNYQKCLHTFRCRCENIVAKKKKCMKEFHLIIGFIFRFRLDLWIWLCVCVAGGCVAGVVTRTWRTCWTLQLVLFSEQLVSLRPHGSKNTADSLAPPQWCLNEKMSPNLPQGHKNSCCHIWASSGRSLLHPKEKKKKKNVNKNYWI